MQIGQPHSLGTTFYAQILKTYFKYYDGFSWHFKCFFSWSPLKSTYSLFNPWPKSVKTRQPCGFSTVCQRVDMLEFVAKICTPPRPWTASWGRTWRWWGRQRQEGGRRIELSVTYQVRSRWTLLLVCSPLHYCIPTTLPPILGGCPLIRDFRQKYP